MVCNLTVRINLRFVSFLSQEEKPKQEATKKEPDTESGDGKKL